MRRTLGLTAAVVLVVAAFVSVRAEGASRLALVIGNDAYVAPWTLPSCVNDAKEMAQWLKTVGYEESEIKLLTDARRADMVAALEDLAQKAKQQHPEQVVVYFSGHGIAVKDDDGDEGELDGMDEALVAIDDPRQAGELEKIVVRDDLFYKYLTQISQTSDQLIIVMDCCHSGGLSKSIPKDVTPPKGKVKFIHSREIEEYLAKGQVSKGLYKTAPARSKSIGDSNNVPREVKGIRSKGGVIFLSSSNQFQLSQAGEKLSAFTEVFLNTIGPDRDKLVAASGTNALTLKATHQELTRALFDLPQTPILECRGVKETDAFIPGLFPTPTKWEEEKQATGIIAQLLSLPEDKMQRNWQLNIAPTKNEPLQVGERFALKVTTNADGYLVMFTVGASGNVTFLYPNRFRSINEVKSGTTAVLPYKDGLQVTPPAGEERFYVYLLEKNPFETFEFGKTSGGLPAGSLEGILRQNPQLRNRIDRVNPAELTGWRSRGMVVERVSNLLREDEEIHRRLHAAAGGWARDVATIQTKQ